MRSARRGLNPMRGGGAGAAFERVESVGRRSPVAGGQGGSLGTVHALPIICRTRLSACVVTQPCELLGFAVAVVFRPSTSRSGLFVALT